MSMGVWKRMMLFSWPKGCSFLNFMQWALCSLFTHSKSFKIESKWIKTKNLNSTLDALRPTWDILRAKFMIQNRINRNWGQLWRRNGTENSIRKYAKFKISTRKKRIQSDDNGHMQDTSFDPKCRNEIDTDVRWHAVFDRRFSGCAGNVRSPQRLLVLLLQYFGVLIWVVLHVMFCSLICCKSVEQIAYSRPSDYCARLSDTNRYTSKSWDTLSFRVGTRLVTQV